MMIHLEAYFVTYPTMTVMIGIEEKKWKGNQNSMSRAAVGSRRTPAINTLSSAIEGFTAFVLKFKASSEARIGNHAGLQNR